MSTHPRLQPFATVIRRSSETIQVGLTPDAGVVLSGLSPADIALLALLDGHLDTGGLRRAASRLGCPPSRVDQLLGALRHHGLLIDGVAAGKDRRTSDATPAEGAPEPSEVALWSASAPGGRRLPPPPPRSLKRLALGEGVGDLVGPGMPSGTRPPGGDRDLGPDIASVSAASLSGVDGLEVVGARTKRMVLVDGRGRLVEGIAETLRQGGIGSVHGGGSVADWWDLASRDYSRANQPDVFTHTQPDLVVLVAAGALEVDAGDTWWRSSVPHLPVVASGHRVAIGPLIRPGGPCLRCLDLHRSDRDPGWPAVLAQLSPAIPGQGPPVQADSVLTSIVAGVTAQLVHNHLDGIRPAPHGVSVELAYGELGMVARRWVPHPRCGCRAPRETMAS